MRASPVSFLTSFIFQPRRRIGYFAAFVAKPHVLTSFKCFFVAIFILSSCIPLSDIMTSEGNPMPRFKASLPAHQLNTRIVPYRPLKLQWGNCIFNPPKPSKPFFSVGAYGSQPKSKRRATTRRWFAADAPKRKRGGGRTNRPPLRRSTPRDAAKRTPVQQNALSKAGFPAALQCIHRHPSAPSNE